ncbi:MAG: hypothetical protein ACJ8ER_09355 [Allosphingosinicella sp.]
MRDRAFPILPFAALAAALALAACNRAGGEENLADLNNDTDPAIASALNDQILVDPDLANQSNRNAVRPASTPAQTQYPSGSTGGGAASGASAKPAVAGTNCSDPNRFDYNLRWAGRLSPNFPVYPGGKVTEAAANNSSGCSTRAVTFTTSEGWQRILDWYHTRAVQAGYSSEHQLRDGTHVLAGANDKDNGAFYLIVTPKGSGSEVDLIANNGR